MVGFDNPRKSHLLSHWRALTPTSTSTRFVRARIGSSELVLVIVVAGRVSPQISLSTKGSLRVCRVALVLPR